MQWAQDISDAVAALNIILAIYNVLLLYRAGRYHLMAMALLDGAWGMREWPVHYMVASRTRQRGAFKP
jgi:hypothetical protein